MGTCLGIEVAVVQLLHVLGVLYVIGIVLGIICAKTKPFVLKFLLLLMMNENEEEIEDGAL